MIIKSGEKKNSFFLLNLVKITNENWEENAPSIFKKKRREGEKKTDRMKWRGRGGSAKRCNTKISRKRNSSLDLAALATAFETPFSRIFFSFCSSTQKIKNKILVGGWKIPWGEGGGEKNMKGAATPHQTHYGESKLALSLSSHQPFFFSPMKNFGVYIFIYISNFGFSGRR